MEMSGVMGGGSPLLFAEAIARRRRSGQRIISLGLGEPDFSTPPHIVEAAVRSLHDGHTRYVNSFGIPELRDVVATTLADQTGHPFDSADVVVAAGAKAGLFLALAAALDPGDEVVNMTPCYVSNHPIIKAAEPSSRVIDVDLTVPDFRLDLEAIRAALSNRTRALVLNYPNSPTGAGLHPDDLQGLVGILDGTQCLIISDEVYAGLPLSRPHISPASRPELAERCIVVSGASKTHAMTGWRLGWLAGPPEIVQRAAALNLQIQTCVPPFIQHAGVAALTGPQNHVREFIGRISRRLEALDSQLVSPQRLRRGPVHGGFFAFIETPGLSSEALSAELVDKHGVAVLAGSGFGSSFDSWIRVSLSSTDEDLALGALAISNAVREGVLSS